MPIHFCIVCGYFFTIIAALSTCNRDGINLNTDHLHLYRKHLSPSDLEGRFLPLPCAGINFQGSHLGPGPLPASLAAARDGESSGWPAFVMGLPGGQGWKWDRAP